jgi:hypothetical protein
MFQVDVLNRRSPIPVVCVRTAIALTILFLPTATIRAQGCKDVEQETAGVHSFRRAGEVFEIPLTGLRSSDGQFDCQPDGIELRWSNGRNNGSNLHLAFLDAARQPIYTKEISAFLHGNIHFPFGTMENQRWVRSGSVMMTVTSVSSAPQTVTIQAVRPIALPATISYRISFTRVRRQIETKRAEKESTELYGVEGKSPTIH